MPWCPKCRAEFREGFAQCNTCGIPLVAELPPEEEEMTVDEGSVMARPTAVYMAANRLEATMVCDMLHEEGIAALSRPAAFRQIQAYSGADARFGVEVLVDEAQAVRARQMIDELNEGLQAEALDEDRLARMAEEQSMEETAQPAEDNAAFRLLPVVLGVIAGALVLLYLVTSRM